MSENSTTTDELGRPETVGSATGDSLDDVFELLASERRRHALRCLHEFDDPLALADLADEVAARENDAPITELSGETVKRVYTSLYHTHVPKLAAANLVRYDQELDAVALADDADRYQRLLE